VPVDGGEGLFAIDASSVTFGRGALAEVGPLVKGLGVVRIVVMTDRVVAELEHVAQVMSSLRSAGVDAVLYDRVRVEPTDSSFLEAAAFAKDGRFDGYVSVGGGSVIDTCKAAALYATYPADFLTYVNAPVGAGASVPGPLPPHVACPTTAGTGSELTGIAVCDIVALHAKTGIASRRLRPTLAVVDPNTTRTLPGSVVAACGFDVLCHALESFTARPFTARSAPGTPAERPMSQGRNPWSDLGSLEALRLCGRYLLRAVADSTDDEAREQMMWAATLAGIAFGNAGVHLPHGMAYAVAGNVKDFRMPAYPDEEPLIPHGIAVVTSAPEAFRFTAAALPERHLDGAAALGEDLRGATSADAGPIVAACLERLMHATHVPIGLDALGFGEADVSALVRGTIVQKRLLQNAPCAVTEASLEGVFRAAMSRTGRRYSATHLK
jgi:hydroxyacid-oxoacid transhydrogenase